MLGSRLPRDGHEGPLRAYRTEGAQPRRRSVPARGAPRLTGPAVPVQLLVPAQALAGRARGRRPSHIAPHDLRHSFVSNQLGAGTPIHMVRDMAAHRSLSVTALYAHSTDEARRAASQRVQIAVLPARRDTNGDTKPKFKTRNRAKSLVPRDGIEPPTRGFSSLRPVWPRPRKTRGGREVEEAAAADLQRIAVLRPRFPRTGRTG